MKERNKQSFEGKKNWENYYWYYYKWYMLGGIALILAIIICVSQCSAKVNPDYCVLFSADTYVTDEALAEVTTELEKISVDINGDGKVKVQAINCTFPKNDYNSKTAARQKAMLQVQSAETCIWVLDDSATDIYYNTDSIDVFAQYEKLDAYDSHAVSIDEIPAFNSLQKGSEGKETFYLFCRKGKNSNKIDSTAKSIIDKALNQNDGGDSKK